MNDLLVDRGCIKHLGSVFLFHDKYCHFDDDLGLVYYSEYSIYSGDVNIDCFSFCDFNDALFVFFSCLDDEDFELGRTSEYVL